MLKLISSISITSVSDFFQIFISCMMRREMLQGKAIDKFEKNFAKYIGTKHAIVVSSARYAMQLILKSLNLKKGSEIIMSSYTFDGLIPLIREIGLTPIFVDIEVESFNLDASEIERKITKKTKVILATHLFGLPCNMKKVMKISRNHNLLILEDCSHSIGAEYSGKKVGLFGKAAFFSLGVTKQINTFGGGIVTTNDDELAKQIRKLANKNKFAAVNLFSKVLLNYAGYIVLNSFLNHLALRLLITNFFHEFVKKSFRGGYGVKGRQNFKYTSFQAAIGESQLRMVNKKNIDRIEKATLYKKLLGKIPKIHLPNIREVKNGTSHIYQDFVIRVGDNAAEICKFLLKNNIYAVIGNDVMQSCVENAPEKFPNTKKWQRRGKRRG